MRRATAVAAALVFLLSSPTTIALSAPAAAATEWETVSGEAPGQEATFRSAPIEAPPKRRPAGVEAQETEAQSEPEEAAPEPEGTPAEEAGAEEQLFAEVDGVTCYQGEPNYPVWSMGKRVGAVADLSSAYISDANDRWRLVGFLSFPVVLRSRGGFSDTIPLEAEVRECFFWQRARDGSFFFNRNGRPFRKVEGAAFEREARVYRMIFEAAVANMGEDFVLPDAGGGAENAEAEPTAQNDEAAEATTNDVAAPTVKNDEASPAKNDEVVPAANGTEPTAKDRQ